MQIDFDIAKRVSLPKSTPKVKFQCGGRPFAQTGSSNNCVYMSSKFGVRIHLDISKRVLSLKRKPEVDFSLYGRHLEKSI